MRISINQSLSEFYISGERTINVVGIIRSNIGIELLKYDNVREESIFSYSKDKFNHSDIMTLYKLAQKTVSPFTK